MKQLKLAYRIAGFLMLLIAGMCLYINATFTYANYNLTIFIPNSFMVITTIAIFIFIGTVLILVSTICDCEEQFKTHLRKL